MNFLVELWSVIASSVISWFATVENAALSKISNLLTILVIIIGLIDWSVRKLRHRANAKDQKRHKHLDVLEGTQKPFKVVNMLNNPMRTSEKIGALIEDTSKMLGGKKMKKFFKWLWYNKEQLLSIAYNVAIIALTNFLLWSDMLNGLFDPILSPEYVLTSKIAALIASVGFTVLTVRNVCVTYGISSLETIDKVLAERAEAAERQLTPEQKKALKSNISILQDTLEKAKAELKAAETELEKITVLYSADNTFVTDFVVKRQTLEKKIAVSKTVVTNIEGKISALKATLNGNTTEKK